MSDRTPELAIVAVLVVLVAAALLFGSGGQDGDARADAATVAPERLARVERRVEELRGLRFRRRVRVEVLSAEEVRAFGVAETEKALSPAQRAAREEVLKLVGLIEPDVDLDDVTAAIYGEQVAGFYDPRSERLALVEGVGVDDLTLAHELAHALEDQHFDLERFGDPGRGRVADDDARVAEQALVEGTATVLMMRYLDRHPDAMSFGDALRQMWGAAAGRPLPPYVLRSLLFPYEQGERFVTALLRAGDDWSLVDNALRHRPPVSTAELFDAARWLRVTRPQPVRLPGRAAFGAGWRRALTSSFGELDLREVLRDALGAAEAATVASGWTGGRYALWSRGPLPAAGCTAPCRERSAFTLALRFETPRAAATAAGALRRWQITAPGAGSAGAAVTRRGAAVTAALAPTPALATRLVRAAAR